MTDQSSMHAYLNWTKQRIDEMDATLASLEAKAGQMTADSKIKTDQLVADLKKRRDEFQAQAKAQVQAGGAALQASKTQLEAQWKAYEAQVKTYFDTAGKQLEQQQATFRDVANAQIKAWREAADTFYKELGKVAAARQGDVDAAVKQMKADAGAGGIAFAEAAAGGNRNLGGAGCGVGGITQGFRPRQSDRGRCGQARHDGFGRLSGRFRPIVSASEGGAYHGDGCNCVA